MSARGFSFALVLLTTLAAAPARAQTLADVPINASTNLFCRGNDGLPVFQTYANLGKVMQRWNERFKFEMSVQPGNPLTVLFSAPAASPYSISYVVTPYRDVTGRTGIVLKSMHLFLENADRDVDGSAMCFFTVFGKSGRHGQDRPRQGRAQTLARLLVRRLKDELDIEVEPMDGQRLLDLFSETAGASYYNQGLYDARAVVEDRAAALAEAMRRLGAGDAALSDANGSAEFSF